MRRPGVMTVVRPVLAAAAVWAIYLLRANVWFRLYPAVAVGAALAVFAASLFGTPVAESVARRSGVRLDGRGVAYCRSVTRVWTVFLAAHLAVTVGTVFASYEIWAVYNGFVAYVLMGSLFLGEWLCRRRVLRG
ncbi:MAG: hypothetical protein J6T01_03800 [Kiritimatiellae bacterium]|nr:hypothetical protein [Kiritimatiellia bacterium]